MTRLLANRKIRDQSRKAAQVGIGTMIVFIATILVAAIAAAVLIDTSGKLQERSSRTGQQATEQVSSNLAVESAVGRRNATDDAGLKYLYLFVTLAPGAREVDLNQLRIQVQNSTVLKTLSYTDQVHPDLDQFSAKSVRDPDSSFTTAKPVMTSGDLVNLTIDLAINTAEFEPRGHVDLVLMPEVGSHIAYGFDTPPSYGVKRMIELR